ncbi:LptF/LptG family permease [Emticicia sp. BO119]|uniref:LptF/LptG family permease n=1 Tax=Emticicia sp. BO119 TaxID=2757768 RepID=UPI0015F0ECD8|nr:LptF/LptG family permease [Emticicia sp. BO119]MBA4851774.1 LptF/LptG family permease [Emticicia sp. BO119]
MNILDKYLIKRFLTTYVFAVVVIVLIIMVIDFVEKNDDFIQKQAPMRAILLQYYANLAPYWANYISPLMIFISTVFFTAQMAAHTEIVAILSSGISFRRLMLPYFIGASIIAVFSFVMVGWILPRANTERLAFENVYVNDKFYFSARDFHTAVAPNTYAYMSSYNNEAKTGYDFTLERIVNNKLVEKLSAKRITWDDSTKKWKLHDYKIRTLGIMKDRMVYGTSPKDTVINLFPKDFESERQIQESFTIPELQEKIDLINSRGAEGIETFQIELYQRFATPFAVIILSLMGLIVSARKARGGVGFQIAIGFVLAFVYILFYIMSKGIAESGNMPPILAVWLPNIVFGIIGTVMYFTVPR